MTNDYDTIEHLLRNLFTTLTPSMVPDILRSKIMALRTHISNGNIDLKKLEKYIAVVEYLQNSGDVCTDDLTQVCYPYKVSELCGTGLSPYTLNIITRPDCMKRDHPENISSLTNSGNAVFYCQTIRQLIELSRSKVGCLR